MGWTWTIWTQTLFQNVTSGVGNLAKVWLQELQVAFDPTPLIDLPCGKSVVGIALTPLTATNDTGTKHTVTATLTDLLNNPQVGVAVAFAVVSGPNAGASGTCSVNANCTTDANGQVSFTYTGAGGVGIDQIQACFEPPEDGGEICSQLVTKEWVPGVQPIPAIGLLGALSFMALLGGSGVLASRRNRRP